MIHSVLFYFVVFWEGGGGGGERVGGGGWGAGANFLNAIQTKLYTTIEDL